MPCLEKYICIIHLQNNIPGDRVKYYRSDNKERIHEESNFPSADRHPHGQSLWATCYRQKPQCHSSKLANASETPQENENGSSVHLQETIKGSLWASSPCQGLTTPFPDCHLTRFRIQQNSVAAIRSKHPQRRPGKEAKPCPAPSLPACPSTSPAKSTCSKYGHSPHPPILPQSLSLSLSPTVLPQARLPTPFSTQIPASSAKAPFHPSASLSVNLFSSPTREKGMMFLWTRDVRFAEEACLSREGLPESEMPEMETRPGCFGGPLLNNRCSFSWSSPGLS